MEEHAAERTFIPQGCDLITPRMIALASLNQDQIDRILDTVPGGANNVQDICALSPLQEGMLFHHLLNERDTYVLSVLFELRGGQHIQRLINAVQVVVDRHDILRSAILWDNLPQPIQVVYRSAELPVERLVLEDDRDFSAQLMERMRPRSQKPDLSRAPILRLYVSGSPNDVRAFALLQVHHLICDHQSLRILISEVFAVLEGRELPRPVPYRHYLDQVLASSRLQEAEAYFRDKLGDVDQPTAPFGLHDVHGDGSRSREAREELDPVISNEIRAQARRCGISPARFFHAAWAIVVARTAGQTTAVFGTVLLTAEQRRENAQRMLGMAVNTLPLRLKLSGLTARELIEHAQRELLDLLAHEMAPLTLAQRCSGIRGAAPLFTSVLNFRHSLPEQHEFRSDSDIWVASRDDGWTNYPIAMTVDDRGDRFAMTAQTDQSVDPGRVIEYLTTSVQSLVAELEREGRSLALALPMLPAHERHRLAHTFSRGMPSEQKSSVNPIHELFEEQAFRAPDKLAVGCGTQWLTYAELNDRANQLAGCLRRRGVGPDTLVALLLERSVEMMISILGIWKAGGAYMPLDPHSPPGRLRYMLSDSAASVLLAADGSAAEMEYSVDVIDLASLWAEPIQHRVQAEETKRRVLSAANLAYVIYTSGSTGKPKAVMIDQIGVINLWRGLERIYGSGHACERVALNASLTFDASVQQIVQLLSGRTITIIPQIIRLDAAEVSSFIYKEQIQAIDCTPSQLKLWRASGLLEYGECPLQLVLVGGEPIDAELWKGLATCETTRFYNVYGPTECVVDSTAALLESSSEQSHIGRPMEGRRIYVLDSLLQPTPVNVTGEICIAGMGIARGYLRRAEMTAQRFVPDLFSEELGDRMYKTGDLGRWREDGRLEFLGRNDGQVKIRGYRIEIGEIEAAISEHPAVSQAVVLANESPLGERRLVAYVTGDRRKGMALEGDSGAGELQGLAVREWENVHEQTYEAHVLDGGPSFVGWNSSSTGEPIPEHEMQEWLSCTVARIRELSPKRVLEIGCGVGLLLQHLAPSCIRYVGADFSAAALESLRRWIRSQAGLNHVELLQCHATDISRHLKDGGFDTILLNSVVQYFPDIDYLMTVLEAVIPLVEKDGTVFLGDIRNLSSLKAFHTAVQLGRSAASNNVENLKRRISRSVAQEKELVIDPEFFSALIGRLPRVTSAYVQLKRGRAANELTRHRYDVVLRLDEPGTLANTGERRAWVDIKSIENLEAELKSHLWSRVWLTSVPDERVVREAVACRVVESCEDWLEVGALRRRLSDQQQAGVDPEKIWELAAQYGYDAVVTPAACGTFDVELTDQRTRNGVGLPGLERQKVRRSWGEYANDPLDSSFQQHLIPQLRQHLKVRMPEYMMPSAWVVLKEFPLTPSGKVDRRGLPAPHGRSEEMGEYIAPQSALERALADIWSELLSVSQIGVKDDFFQLGGHSLLAMKLIWAVASKLAIQLPIQAVFRNPTVQRLADHIEHLLPSLMEAPIPGPHLSLETGTI